MARLKAVQRLLVGTVFRTLPGGIWQTVTTAPVQGPRHTWTVGCTPGPAVVLPVHYACELQQQDPT